VSSSSEALEGAQQLAERLLALPPDDEVHARRRAGPGLGREARVVAAGDDLGARTQRAQALDQPERGAALERHHREADHVGRVLGDETVDRRADLPLCEHQVGHGDAVVRVDVARERGERRVRHADRDRSRVLERVRHREEQDVQRRSSGTATKPQGPIPPSLPHPSHPENGVRVRRDRR